jgi:hypothetical protein
MGQQSWPAWKELIKQQFGTRLWEKKMHRAFENDYFDPVKHNSHQWCLNQKKRIECIYPKLDQEQINDLILNQTKGSLEHNVRCRINEMDCDLSTLIGVMKEVVEMTGINKKHNPSDKKDYTPRTELPKKLGSKPSEPIKKEKSPTCWNCGETGHRSTECTKPRRKINNVHASPDSDSESTFDIIQHEPSDTHYIGQTDDDSESSCNAILGVHNI